MLAALLSATLPVLLGMLLGLAPIRRGWVRPARAAALVGTLAVVLVVLMPEAWSHLGAWSLLVVAAGLLAPEALERLAHGRGRTGAVSGEELVFLGLLVHQAFDGVEVGAAFEAGLRPGLGVAVAVGLHAVPLVAMLMLEMTRLESRRRAVVRGILLTGATALGTLFGHGGAHLFESVHAWLPALLAGLLLHVLRRPHEHEHEHGPGAT